MRSFWQRWAPVFLGFGRIRGGQLGDIDAYLERGLDGLRPRHAPGAKPKLTANLAPALQQWVIDGPVQQGLDRANWTYAELADHLFKTKGIRVRKSAMQVRLTQGSA